MGNIGLPSYPEIMPSLHQQGDGTSPIMAGEQLQRKKDDAHVENVYRCASEAEVEICGFQAKIIEPKAHHSENGNLVSEAPLLETENVPVEIVDTPPVSGTTPVPTVDAPVEDAPVETGKVPMETDTTSVESDYTETESVPVIIIGAGPVGLLLALRLAQSNIRSMVVEKDKMVNMAPRAIGYYGPVHHVFHDAGIYEQVAAEGLACGGYTWRAPLDDQKEGGKVLGRILAQNVMSKPDETGRYPIGQYTIQLSQARLAEIMLEEVQKTGLVSVIWNALLVDLTQDNGHVTAKIQDQTQDNYHEIRGEYLVGCDGGRSAVRKFLGISLSGHSWPERFIATDVLRTPPLIPEIPVHFTVDPEYWAVVTPLEKVEAGVRSLWRYSMAVTNASLSDEEIMTPEYVDSLLLRQIDGPRPSDHTVVRKSLYKMHQLLASTLYRGRCFLAGDAAHLNNPIGGLGLCTGLLDADALHQTLKVALATDDGATLSPDQTRLFHRYSASRRQVFSRIIHPLSSENKVRLHSALAEDTATEDWYLQILQQRDIDQIQKVHNPLYQDWRTTMSPS